MKPHSPKLWSLAAAILSIAALTTACQDGRQSEVTPWGTVVGGEEARAESTDGIGFTFSEIIANGELIMLTLSGPETYYDYHGRGMGLQYLLCERFAQEIGVSLRVDLCQDTSEMVSRLLNGEGDLIAFPLTKDYKGVLRCGYAPDSLSRQWAVRTANKDLADSLNRWFRPIMLSEIRNDEAKVLASQGVVRKVYSPMLNRAGGVISKYDHLFRKYAPVARWDWRLLAAQCYQESTYDPNARSWAGACGLMQIMPRTAKQLGLPLEQIYDPEANIAAAAKYISELKGHFSDIADPTERNYFVLAAYNGGFFHIRDAMTLTQKHGKNPHRWQDVEEYVLKLSTPQFYRDPLVKYGYMRGSETVNYVAQIRNRWAQYRGMARPDNAAGGNTTPHPAKRKNKYKVM